MKLSREQFRAQFFSDPANRIEWCDPYSFGGNVKKFIQIIKLDSVVHGYPIYRALERLAILDVDGCYYLNKRLTA